MRRSIIGTMLRSESRGRRAPRPSLMIAPPIACHLPQLRHSPAAEVPRGGVRRVGYGSAVSVREAGVQDGGLGGVRRIDHQCAAVLAAVLAGVERAGGSVGLVANDERWIRARRYCLAWGAGLAARACEPGGGEDGETGERSYAHSLP